MAEPHDEESEGLYDDNPVSEGGLTSDRGPKRRRLNTSISDDGGASLDYGSDSYTSYATSANECSKQGENDEEEVGKEKPKSKYKIHIPKNSDLPRDAFFTQPPQRSSSPYRIDDFHWQKPRKPSPPPSAKQRRTPPQNPYVNSRSTPLGLGDHNVISRKSPSALAGSPGYHASHDYNHLIDDMLEDISDDEFAVPAGVTNSAPEPIFVNSQSEISTQHQKPQRLKAPLINLKQTTLFGIQAHEASSQTQSVRKHNWPLANREEAPTHHKLNSDALNTWVYPTNLGTIREYQYGIVAKGLYHNLLVALPTGLGKTFIAATIMLNWFRWTEDAQIVFVAPTKPLVSQQVKACFDIVGIPRSATSMLTGSTVPGIRAEEWNSKRVFFMTPQTIINDLKTGICDPKRLVLLVVDEAHRATGNYAYVEVVRFVRRFNSSFRVLALTATPGSSVETVQEVIDGLGISRVEIRTEESIDIRQYVHSRKIETILFENSEEIAMVMELFSKALQPLVDQLTGQNAYWSKDPMALTPYGCNQARQRWMLDAGKRASFPVKAMVNNIFSLLASLSHATELLRFHGIGPFYHKVLAFRNEIHAGGKKGSKYARQVNESEPFQTMMARVQIWINTSEFVGHPKLEYLQGVVLNHFLDAGEGRGASDPSSTRIMVFAHYRDSAEEICRILKRNEPMIRPHVFVGQQKSTGSEGMGQKKQLDIIQKFKSGVYNTLVATSIGEEGLDIGEVDLIVCYDASASPIRMLQRMGRTGRKRAGNIVVMLMKGKEENNFTKAKDNYEKMQVEIASGARFNFRDDESRRILPKGTQPIVDKRVIEIPLENTQADLPEPRRKGKAPKRPPKKFHMPDNVRNGFVKASRLDDNEASDEEVVAPAREKRTSNIRTRGQIPVDVPFLEEVVLTPSEQTLFETNYLDIRGDEPQIVEHPRMDAFPKCQRTGRPTRHVAHGGRTEKIVAMLKAMHGMVENPCDRFARHLLREDQIAGKTQADKRIQFFEALNASQTSSDASRARTGPMTRVPTFATQASDPRLDRPSKAIALSSEDEADADRDIGDLLVDSEDESDVLSSQSPRRANRNKEATEIEMDSDDGLPDFSTLVKKDDECKEIERRPRRTGKRVLDDDSDDG